MYGGFVSQILLLLVELLLLSCLTAVTGQDLVVPSTWTNTTSNLSRESRELLASGAAMALRVNVDPSVQTSPNLGSSPPNLPQLRYFSSTFAVWALQDYYSGNSTWLDTVVGGLPKYLEAYGFYGRPPHTINSDSVYWGLALFYAFRTYRQQSMLEQAILAWNTTYNSGFITSEAAASGTGAGRTVTFLPPTDCVGGTYAGGVFLYKDVKSAAEINAFTVAPFMTLSAYLFEETNDPMYQQAAQLSLDFSLNRLWNGTVFKDAFWALNCTYLDSWTSLDQWFVEGISVWANITKNDTLTSFLEMVVSNVTTFSLWNQDDGIIKEGPDPQDWNSISKGIFIRGLAEARMRNPGTALAQYIESYITVQLNALLAHARVPNTNFYTTAWSSGPTNALFNASGNIAALDVLNAAFSFVTPTGSSQSVGPSSPTTNDSPTNPTRKSDVGAVAGSVVGGVIVLATMIMFFWLWYRRRHHADDDPASSQKVFVAAPRRQPATNAEPFMLQSPLTPSSKWHRLYALGPLNDISTSLAGSPETEPVATSERETYDTGAATRTDQTDLPALVSRLYDLLQRRNGSEELPPQYDEHS